MVLHRELAKATSSLNSTIRIPERSESKHLLLDFDNFANINVA